MFVAILRTSSKLNVSPRAKASVHLAAEVILGRILGHRVTGLCFVKLCPRRTLFEISVPRPSARIQVENHWRLSVLDDDRWTYRDIHGRLGTRRRNIRPNI